MKDIYENMKVHTFVVNPSKYSERCPVCNKTFYDTIQISPYRCCSVKCQNKYDKLKANEPYGAGY